METTPTTNAGAARSAKTPSITPGRRAISAEPPSSRRSVHTPLDRTTTRDLANSIRRGTLASGGRRNNAPTPHAKAARRALDLRRTAIFTPGKNRRRSQGANRESPMAVLGRLARITAPKTEPIPSSSSPRDSPASDILPIRNVNEDDDELPIDPPRLSLPLDEDDEPIPDPPQSSFLEGNYTVQSIELPRRFQSEQPGSRTSLGSFGSGQFSEIFENQLEEEVGQDSDLFPPELLDDLRARADENYEILNRGDDRTVQTTLGRDSDIGVPGPVDFDEQTTFLMSDPLPGLPPSSPPAEQLGSSPAGFEPLPDFGNDVAAGDDTEDEIVQADQTEQDGDLRLSSPRPHTSSRPKASKRKRISKHGIEYPPLPPAFVKRVAQTALQTSGLSNHRVSPETLTALTQASEWFFEQLGEDLGAYASHAKRKTIEESDVVTLMRRQRQVGSNATMFSLAQKHLPRELLQELRMPVPQPVKTRRSKKARIEVTDEVTEIT
ncbi:Inner kinetochore subunit cnp20 [Paramyrothecium foliicola]|nr:Inner kinetochore subunit cnp20 [Paramyrothecium foliicola]